MAASPLTRLAEQLLERSRALDSYNRNLGHDPASFDRESFVDAPLDVEDARKSVINLAQDLKRLAQGPRDLLFESLNTVGAPASHLSWSGLTDLSRSQFNDLANLHFLYRHQVPKHVPVAGDISYADLAAASGLDEVLLRRMVRVAMMNRIFVETDDGRVRHSAASRILHAEPDAMDACGFLLEEMFVRTIPLVNGSGRRRVHICDSACQSPPRRRW
ncbi:hypothetical protein VTK73DRAFT_5207 [Phialemonium thermophilum]|uniref:Uncharacterized protein n=1 Tax=Phialemonium thermophilum TaxID=223376 RepID=A0ABR3V3Y3_9PEZI